MNRSFILIAMAAFLFTNSAFAIAADSSSRLKQIEFDIDGKKLGIKLTEEFLKQYCSSHLQGNQFIECKQSIELSGIKLSVLYFFYKSKLISISMIYPSSQYELLTNLYTEKFSKLPMRKEEYILVGDSVEYINKKSSWNTIAGKFVIEKYNTGFNKGIAYLKSDEYEKYVANKKEEFSPGIIKKIFGDIFD